MTAKEKLRRIEELEAEIRQEIDGIKSEIISAIEQQPTTAKTISLDPCVFTIKASELSKANCWSPSYFLPAIQAQAVRNELDKANTLNALKNRISEMESNKPVKLNGEIVRLNRDTISALIESDIGRG